ncbi:MAG: hypothetical protein CMP81_17890 [Fulvimarina sp.]|nr:hypothetical protein [Fulvimarina sp.]
MKRLSKEWTSLQKEHRGLIEEYQSDIPVKIGAIAAHLGLEVKVATLDIGISGMIMPVDNDEKYKILVNKHEPNYRRRFTLSHEIAHYLLHRDLIGDGLKDNILYRSKLSDAREAEANRLAADILMPPIQIKKWMESNSGLREADAVSKLAEYFDVSEDAMRIRLGMKS